MRFTVFTALIALSLTACDKLPTRPKTAFNADSAWSYTQQQVNFGPRVPGTPAAAKAGDLYVTHWDTRPMADSDPVLGNRNTPILGANDGASGVGLFIALGDALKKTPPNVGVDLLFVDGEDYGVSFNPPYVDVLLGSQYFVSHLPAPDYKPMYGVLWDMIADRYLNILQEVRSVNAAPEVVSRVWEKANELGYSYHHTLGDTMEHISKQSLQIVGDVALALITQG